MYCGEPTDLTDQLEELLRSLGATEADLAEARQSGRPSGLAADLVLGRGAVLTAVETARRLGVDPEKVSHIWRMLGVVVPGLDEPFFTGRDVELSACLLGFAKTTEAGDELLRILGSTMSRLAEAAVALYVQTVEPAPGSPEKELEWAASMASTVQGAIEMGDHLGGLLSHQLRSAIDLQREAQSAVSTREERALFRLLVGFVDLVGSTPLASLLSTPELVGLVGYFEAQAFDVVTSLGGRVVKHIGDEIMFVAVDPVAGCRIAGALMEAFDDRGIEPRAGLAYGDVVTRYGDFYGPVVNLAARLADLAIPKEILVDEQLMAAAGTEIAFASGGRRMLKGFGNPVPVFSVDYPVPEPSSEDGRASARGRENREPTAPRVPAR